MPARHSSAAICAENIFASHLVLGNRNRSSLVIFLMGAAWIGPPMARPACTPRATAALGKPPSEKPTTRRGHTWKKLRPHQPACLRRCSLGTIDTTLPRNERPGSHFIRTGYQEVCETLPSGDQRPPESPDVNREPTAAKSASRVRFAGFNSRAGTRVFGLQPQRRQSKQLRSNRNSTNNRLVQAWLEYCLVGHLIATCSRI